MLLEPVRLVGPRVVVSELAPGPISVARPELAAEPIGVDGVAERAIARRSGGFAGRRLC